MPSTNNRSDCANRRGTGQPKGSVDSERAPKHDWSAGSKEPVWVSRRKCLISQPLQPSACACLLPTSARLSLPRAFAGLGSAETNEPLELHSTESSNAERMNWFNVSVDILQRPEFTAAEPAEVGIWLRMACYCAAQENGGIIRDCRHWTDRQWLIAAGVTKADVDTETKLWRWNAAGGITVLNYPTEKEREVQLKRKAGKATAKRRWGKRLAAQNNSSPDSSARSSPNAEEEVEGNGSTPHLYTVKSLAHPAPAA